jgi:tRNA U34 5-methylaminomethyl-2-thiouridine-forming methyltransferase MnmC
MLGKWLTRVSRSSRLFNTMTSRVPQLTQDGSYTFFSAEFGETFHSIQGARAEAFQKFAEATRLAQKAARLRTAETAPLRLLDVCYGLGYNSAAALERLWQVQPDCAIELYALELDPTVPVDALAPSLLAAWSAPVQAVLKNLGKAHIHSQHGLEARLLLGDARQTVQRLIQKGFKADAIFFDPFSPQRCPQLWTVEFFQAIAQCLAPDGILSTYSRSAAVRSAIGAAGLCIGTIPPPEHALPHEWSQGTVAAWDALTLYPLSQMEQEHLKTRASVPYRDPDLVNSQKTIVSRHRQDQSASALESTSSWRRRWGIR